MQSLYSTERWDEVSGSCSRRDGGKVRRKRKWVKCRKRVSLTYQLYSVKVDNHTN